MTEDNDFGPCCACEGFANVRNILMLHVKAPVPGTGWGCVVCHKKSDGAVAVLCDRCFLTNAPIFFVVHGYLMHKQRVKIDELTEPFEHDLRFHKNELEVNHERMPNHHD
jgi:hypothetical protein